MDIISHGLWGGAASYSMNKRKSFWLAFLFGIMPDFLAFVPNTILVFLNPAVLKFDGGVQHMRYFLPITYTLYDITHSLFIFAAIFAAVYFFRKRKIFWPMAAWGLHIIMDIPSHSAQFFPTPFLWPFSQFKVNGVAWAQPWFLALDFSALAVVYLCLFIRRRKIAKRLVSAHGAL